MKSPECVFVCLLVGFSTDERVRTLSAAAVCPHLKCLFTPRLLSCLLSLEAEIYIMESSVTLKTFKSFVLDELIDH